MTDAAPPPQGLYVPATRFGQTIYTSGMTPRKDGVLQLKGPIRSGLPVAHYQAAMLLAVQNALKAAQARVEDGERIGGVLSATIYLMTEPGYSGHSTLADLASAFLANRFGADKVGARTTVGVATLPGGTPIEIQLTVWVE